MSSKPQINVCSLAAKTFKVGVGHTGVVVTAEWAVKKPDLHVISAGRKAVRVVSADPVDLRDVNRALRGKRDISHPLTDAATKLESA